jgi:hypothetical protein
MSVVPLKKPRKNHRNANQADDESEPRMTRMTRMDADEAGPGRSCPSAVIRVIRGDLLVFPELTSRFIDLLHGVGGSVVPLKKPRKNDVEQVNERTANGGQRLNAEFGIRNGERDQACRGCTARLRGAFGKTARKMQKCGVLK